MDRQSADKQHRKTGSQHKHTQTARSVTYKEQWAPGRSRKSKAESQIPTTVTATTTSHQPVAVDKAKAISPFLGMQETERERQKEKERAGSDFISIFIFDFLVFLLRLSLSLAIPHSCERSPSPASRALQTVRTVSLVVFARFNLMLCCFFPFVPPINMLESFFLSFLIELGGTGGMLHQGRAAGVGFPVPPATSPPKSQSLLLFVE